MNDSVYLELRKMLDVIPNGFPATESGVEIRLLKKIFTEEEARLATRLKFKFETPAAISQRTGIDKEYLEAMLHKMRKNGQLFGLRLGGTSYYKLMPFIFGIYEFQVSRMDEELAMLVKEYMEQAFINEFFTRNPPLHKVIPIGIDVHDESRIEPYESVVKLIEGAKSWAVQDCICKKNKALIGERCDKPMEVCLAFAPVEHVFDNNDYGRPITKDEAYRILKLSEDAGLVHQTSNTASGHIYICNCCKCCCGLLSSYVNISKNAVAKSNYIAVVDKDLCTSCGVCADRCQADAIEVNEYAHVKDCIGCGLCVSTCQSEAIKLVRRESQDQADVPRDEIEWWEKRACDRGIGDEYKKFL